MPSMDEQAFTSKFSKLHRKVSHKTFPTSSSLHTPFCIGNPNLESNDSISSFNEFGRRELVDNSNQIQSICLTSSRCSGDYRSFDPSIISSNWTSWSNYIELYQTTSNFWKPTKTMECKFCLNRANQIALITLWRYVLNSRVWSKLAAARFTAALHFTEPTNRKLQCSLCNALQILHEESSLKMPHCWVHKEGCIKI